MGEATGDTAGTVALIAEFRKRLLVLRAKIKVKKL
jgi:hypothetical protein